MVVVWGVSVDSTILYTFLSTPDCTACTDMVYSKELEHDIATTAMSKAILRLKILAFIPSQNMIGSFFSVQMTNKGCHVHAMKKSRSRFDLVTVLISKKSFFNIAFGLFSKVNQIYME